jgi:hypothetical protein
VEFAGGAHAAQHALPHIRRRSGHRVPFSVEHVAVDPALTAVANYFIYQYVEPISKKYSIYKPTDANLFMVHAHSPSGCAGDLFGG